MNAEVSSIDAAPICLQLQLDPSKYRQHLEDFDLTEEQQTELLTILWRILATFVDLGFGVDSVQTLLPALADAAVEDEAERVDEEPLSEG